MSLRTYLVMQYDRNTTEQYHDIIYIYVTLVTNLYTKSVKRNVEHGRIELVVSIGVTKRNSYVKTSHTPLHRMW